jgi:hypothetical protein
VQNQRERRGDDRGEFQRRADERDCRQAEIQEVYLDERRRVAEELGKRCSPDPRAAGLRDAERRAGDPDGESADDADRRDLERDAEPLRKLGSGSRDDREV